MSVPAPASRHAGLDALKGLLIVAVVIGHWDAVGFGVDPFGPLRSWVYYIHVPLFLAVSALFLAWSGPARLVRRLGMILVPYALWMLILRRHQLIQDPVALFTDIAWGNFAHVMSVLWFLPALASLTVLMSAWRWAEAGPGPIRALAAAGLLAAGTAAWTCVPWLIPWHDRIPFGADVALVLLPWVVVIDRLWRSRAAILPARPGLALASAAALVVVGWAMLHLLEPVKTHNPYGHRIDLAQLSVALTPGGIVGMTALAAGLLLAADRLPAPRLLVAIGMASMPIFILHYEVLVRAAHRAHRFAADPAAAWAWALAAFIVAIAAPWLAARIASALIPAAAWLGLASGAPARTSAAVDSRPGA
ncbi:MAG: Acyltransferase family [Planctomycetota bacterium]